MYQYPLVTRHSRVTRKRMKDNFKTVLLCNQLLRENIEKIVNIQPTQVSV